MSSSSVSSGGPQLVAGLEQVTDGIATLLESLQTDDPADPGFREGLLLVSGGISQLLGNLQTNDPANPGFREGLLQVSGGLTQLLGNLQTNDPANPGFREGLVALQQAAAGAAAGFAGSDPAAANVFSQINAGLTGLIASLGNTANPPDQVTIIGAIESMSAGMTQLLAGLGNTANPPDQVTVIGSLESMAAGMSQLVAGLGDNSDPPSQLTIIGALQLMYGALSTQIVPGTEALVDGVVGGIGQVNDVLETDFAEGIEALAAGANLVENGLSNLEFNEPQEALDGKTPHDYYVDCPGCFDPDHEAFDPATADPDFQPHFLEVFELFSDGIAEALPKLQSFDPDNPGLVDGLGQINDGLELLASKLHTFDPKDPGLVDGLELVRGGLQQVNQGLFAINELGIRTMRGQVGDAGDEVGRDAAALEESAREAARGSILASDADTVSATYVFDLPAQTTASNDNARRGAVTALALASSALLARRMRRFDL
jgi:hypothetical protein